jgi:hypothetical protein
MDKKDEFHPDIFYLGVKEVDSGPIQIMNQSLKRLEELQEQKVPEFVITSISARTGKKFCVSVGDTVTVPLAPETFIEIVDYDPVRHSALALGKSKPNENLSLHWFTYRTFPHINWIAVLNISSETDSIKKLDIASAQKEISVFQPEIVMDILPLMKDQSLINLNEKGIAFFNNSMEDLVSDMIKLLNDFPKQDTGEDVKPEGENK